jgi:hypothetical protein
MNSQAITRTVFLASMVFATAAFAGTDVNKCIAPGGQVTITDEVCPDGADTVKLVAGMSDDSDAAPAQTQTQTQAQSPSIERYSTRFAPRQPKLARTAPARGLALDVATLKAARANLQVFDSASQALRSQRLAALQ